jgi:putative Mn2+ efflux pump MntP
MVISHFPAMVLYAFLVSVVFGVIAKNTTRERLLYGLKSFALFIGIALLIGWLMYPFPRHG